METTDKPRLNLRAVRERLALSQSGFAALLGYSARAVQSCEQGWRQPSPALEKAALLLLMSHVNGPEFSAAKCWETKNCPEQRRARCIAYSSRQGHLCWFLTGTLCGGERLHDWPEKRELCFRCSFFRQMLQDAPAIVGEGEVFECPDEGR